MIKKVIYIGGVARSGTSWIGQIFNSVPNIKFKFQPLFSYEFRNTINEDSSEHELEKFYEDLFNNDSEFLTQKTKIDDNLYPSFEKDTLRFLDPKRRKIISRTGWIPQPETGRTTPCTWLHSVDLSN